MSHTTDRLAEYALGMDARRLPPAVSEAVKDALIDLFASAAAGWGAPAACSARRTAERLFASGSSDIWFAGRRQRPEAAAMANSTAASALDLDDGHRAAGGHPGAAILPGVLAVGQTVHASGPEIVAAAAAGYEIAVRIGAARDFNRLDTFSTGRWSAYGVAAAAGRLQGVSRQVLAEAMAIAGVLSPGLSAAGYSAVMGNQVKEGIPWSVLTGLMSLELAAEGMTGPLDILDHPDYFDARAISDDLGDRYAVTNVYFKPYACCRWIHAALDGLLSLMDEEKIEAGSIGGIAVQTFERALRLNNYPDPPTIEAAQYSLPFCLALGAIHGGEALLPIHPSRLSDAAIVALARKVRLSVEPAFDRRFPAEAGARVVLETARGRMEKAVRSPIGDPVNPMGRRRLVAKLRRLASGVIRVEDQSRLLEFITDIENQTIEALGPVLRRSPPGSLEELERWTS
ncbi:MAG: MmgE/PrpD family protein [Desulfobacterales bacterium]